MHSIVLVFIRSFFKAKTSLFLALLAITVLMPMIVPTPTRAVTDCTPNTIRYAGGQWLQGFGVNVCSTGGGGSNYVNNINGVSTYAGEKWQCVEMVNRLYLFRGWTAAHWQGNGNTLIDHLPVGLSEEGNGFISHIDPGDVITLSGNGPGHAAVVNSVNTSGSTTTINIINQNAQQVDSSATIEAGSFADGSVRLGMNNWPLYSVQSIIHHPGHSSSRASTPGVVRKEGAGLHWYLRNTNDGGSADSDFIYGYSSDKLIVGDWDGNGTVTPGLVRKDGAAWHWYLRNSNSGGTGTYDFIYGLSSTDIPVAGDWDHNHTFTPGVVRKDGAGWHWYLRNENSGGDANVDFKFGVYTTDHPVVGDWDGNNSTTIGLYREDNGHWHWYARNTNASGSADADFIYGLSSDTPLTGDWDHTHTFTPGVVRPEGDQLHWYLRNSNDGGTSQADFIYGISPEDTGVAGNWDGI